MGKTEQELEVIAKHIDERCTRCGECVAECAFLQEYGSPGGMADAVLNLPPEQWADAYLCSLCGLCGAVCPEGLNLDALYLSMRRVRFESGAVDLKPYSSILNFEKRGDSEKLSYLNIPSGGDTVLFPGCGVPATRPKTVRRLFTALQTAVPDIGVALGCCMKPSHDLGRTEFFDDRFGRLHTKLLEAGVTRVVTTCPNCQKVFKTHGGSIEAVTAYEMLDQAGYGPVCSDGGEAVIHDPCPQRYDTASQDAVRSLARRASMKILPMKEERTLTRCCGEGGMVGNVRSEFAKNWTRERRRVAGKQRVVTSCSGCVGFLNGERRVDHILDILFDSRPKVKLMGPLSDLARMNLKRWFKKRLP